MTSYRVPECFGLHILIEQAQKYLDSLGCFTAKLSIVISINGIVTELCSSCLHKKIRWINFVYSAGTKKLREFKYDTTNLRSSKVHNFLWITIKWV